MLHFWVDGQTLKSVLKTIVRELKNKEKQFIHFFTSISTEVFPPTINLF
jgi:hypothetical protein